MSKNTTITKETIDRLKALRKGLDTSVRQISEGGGYTHSSLSTLLKEDGDKVVREDTLDRILAGMRSVYYEIVEREGMNMELNKIHRELLSLEMNVSPNNIDIQGPGGFLSYNTLSYQIRKSDNKLDSLLLGNSSPLIVIAGGIQYGKSSALNRFEKLIKKDSSTQVVKIDFAKFQFHPFIEDKEDLTKADLYYVLISSLYESLEIELVVDEFKVDQQKIERIAAGTWALTKLKEMAIVLRDRNKSRLFLSFDSIERLYTRIFPKRNEIADNFLFWLGKIRLEQDEDPLDFITMLVCMSAKSYSSKYSSVLRTQGQLIKLGPFNESHIRKLATVYGLKLDGYKIQKIIELFHGHPYFTHSFIYDLAVGNDFDDLIKRILDLDDSYRNYGRNIEVVLSSILEQDKNIDLSFKEFAQAFSNRKTEYPHIIGALMEELNLLGLIKKNTLETSVLIETFFEKISKVKV